MTRYSDAVDAGYDGPPPDVERRTRNRIHRNAMLDPRDPDFVCDDECETEDDDGGD